MNKQSHLSPSTYLPQSKRQCIFRSLKGSQNASDLISDLTVPVQVFAYNVRKFLRL